MRGPAHRLTAVLLALVTSACSPSPVPPPGTGAPVSTGPTPAPTLPAAPELPFAAGTWPATGTACGSPSGAAPDAGPLIARVEAISERVVRFTLCRPDAAFPARLAAPAIGLLDTAEVAALEADPAGARTVSGAGTYRVESWIPGDNVRLARVGDPSPATRPPVIVLRWNADPAARAAALANADVDAIDAPDAAAITDLETVPEVVLLPRPGLATAYLGFGIGKVFAAPEVRLAFAQAMDRAALAQAAFPAGSTVATHLAPCAVPAGCTGEDWYAFDGPAGADGLSRIKFDRGTPLPLLVPDGPVPGLPDPAATAAFIVASVKENLGVTLEAGTIPAADLGASVAQGTVQGLYLWGVASDLPDVAGFLDPVLGPAAKGAVPARATGVRELLAQAAGTGYPALRAQLITQVNEAIRATIPLVPLVHPGSMAAYRNDVTGAAATATGADPLGTMRAGDRRQLVLMGAAEPSAAWCGIAGGAGGLGTAGAAAAVGGPGAGGAGSQADRDAAQLCALVTPGLLRLDPVTGTPEPALALRCVPDDAALTWSCRLRTDLHFSSGAAVDAGDVLAVVRALADPAGPLRAALPVSAFSAWDGVFGAPAR